MTDYSHLSSDDLRRVSQEIEIIRGRINIIDNVVLKATLKLKNEEDVKKANAGLHGQGI